MKKNILVMTVLSVIAAYSAIAQKSHLLTELITYKVHLKLDEHLDEKTYADASAVYWEMNQAWYRNKLSPLSYQNFVQELHAAAKRGKIKVYDPMYDIQGIKPVFKKMEPNDVAGIGSDTLYMTLYRPFPPYNPFDTILVKTFDLNDIVQIEFMEKWTTNTKTMGIKKEVMAYSIWRKRLDPQTGEFRGTSCMYWVKYR